MAQACNTSAGIKSPSRVPLWGRNKAGIMVIEEVDI